MAGVAEGFCFVPRAIHPEQALTTVRSTPCNTLSRLLARSLCWSKVALILPFFTAPYQSIIVVQPPPLIIVTSSLTPKCLSLAAAFLVEKTTHCQIRSYPSRESTRMLFTQSPADSTTCIPTRELRSSYDQNGRGTHAPECKKHVCRRRSLSYPSTLSQQRLLRSHETVL